MALIGTYVLFADADAEIFKEINNLMHYLNTINIRLFTI